MTPKEKAENIWMKCFQKQIEITGNGDGNLCVEMALIAVDEILNYLGIIEQNETSDFSFGGSYQGDDYFKYWQEVKQEIEKL
jgi:hypothetical protein